MPVFGSPFEGNALGRKLQGEELLRAVRFMHAAELEAVQMYRQVAEATDDAQAKKLIEDIANEEVVHAGEFTALADRLAPADSKLIQQGEQEASEKLEKLASVADLLRAAAGPQAIPRRFWEAMTDMRDFVRKHGEEAFIEILKQNGVLQ